MEWAAATGLKRDKSGNYTYKIRAARSDRVYLGKGGFGITYLADCLSGEYKGAKVVIKTILADHHKKPAFPQLKNDFYAEALKIKGCDHKHIVKVLDLFQESIEIRTLGTATEPGGGFLDRIFREAPASFISVVQFDLPCMVQEYIQGENLVQRLWRKKQPLPESEALKYIQQIGSALAVLHAKNLVHRDVKPANIMLRKPQYEAVLIDFGLVRSTEVKTHTAYLTPGYAPPEQYNSQDDRSPKLDVYALASTLYVLLTGVLDEEGHSRLEDSRTRGNCLYLLGQPDPLQRPEYWNPKISPQVAEAIWQGMALNPAQRPPTMQDWLKLMGLSVLGMPSPVYSPPQDVKPAVKHPQVLKQPEPVKPPEVKPPERTPQTKPTVDARVLLNLPKPGQAVATPKTPQNPSFNLPNQGGTLQFVLVPGGTLKMRDKDGNTIHTVQLQPFYISKYPITQRQYQAIVGKNPSYFQQGTPLDADEQKKGLHYLDRPVEKVTWQDACNFCTQLKAKVPNLKAVDLPSETQWEWAARGATKSQGYEYAGNNDVNEVAWYSDNSNQKTHPVGQLKPNELGLYDMSGNVLEWCKDNWTSSTNELPADGTPLTSGGDSGYRAVRGGSWYNDTDYCRSGNRNYFNPDSSYSNQGFRVVLLLS